MRKIFWSAMALLVVGAATVYWTASFAVKHPKSSAARWATQVAQLGFPGSALQTQRHPRTVTAPAPAAEQEQCEEPKQCFAQEQAPETPASDIPANEPVEVIQVEPWHPDLDVPLSNRTVENTTVSVSGETPTSETGAVVVTVPDSEVSNPFAVEESDPLAPVMPYADEEQDQDNQTVAVDLVSTWLWNFFSNGCSTTGGPDAAVAPEEESEQPAAETDATMQQDQGCPDYHRHYCPRGCPYTGGCPYHYSPRPAYQPSVTPVQEEEKAEPAPQSEPQQKQTRRTSRYTPYIDTMEFRPSDGPGYQVEDGAF